MRVRTQLVLSTKISLLLNYNIRNSKIHVYQDKSLKIDFRKVRMTT